MRYLRLISVLIILFILGVVYYNYADEISVKLSSPENIKDILLSYGKYSSIAFIILTVVEVVAAPFPGQVIAISAGYVFGPMFGTLLTVAGKVIGFAIMFALARKYGRPLARYFITKKEMKHFDVFFKKRGVYALLGIFVFPLFPIDSVSFLCGLSKLKYRTFFIISVIGLIPNTLILTFFGDRLSTAVITPQLIGAGVLVILLYLTYIYRHKLKLLLLEEIRDLEVKAVEIENEIEHEIAEIQKEI